MVSLLHVWHNWRERRDILRDLRRQQGDVSERLHFKVKDQLTYALSALERADHRRATEIWTSLLETYPREARASILALKVLLGLRRYDEAEALMREGQEADPRASYFAVGLVMVAQARGDHETVIERCAVFRKQFPQVQDGYMLAADALISKRRLEDAERLAEQAMKLFPNDVKGYLYFGRIAAERKDWVDALRRWQIVLDRFDHQVSYLGSAQAMQHLGRSDEAEAILLALSVRYPTDASARIELARMSQAAGNTPVAVERWRTVAERFPLFLPGCMAAAEALEKLGEVTQAEEVLREAVDHFPTEQRPLIDLGLLLLRREGYSAAADVWATMRHTFPDAEIGYVQGAQALSRAGRPDDAEALREECRRLATP
jgi:tetratricopeptide (TPR) repeat protein